MSPQLAVFEDLRSWLSTGHRAVLLTLIHAWPSSSRPCGALCAIREDGRLSGSVSGGLIEDELIDLVRAGTYWNRPPRLLRYTSDSDDPSVSRLPAGAHLTLALEPAPQLDDAVAVTDALRARRVVARELDLQTGLVRHRLLHATASGAINAGPDTVRTVLQPSWRVWPVGKTPGAQIVRRLARFVNFEVVDADADLLAVAAGSASQADNGWNGTMVDAEQIELADLDPLTIALVFDDVPQRLKAVLSDAVTAAQARSCVQVQPESMSGATLSTEGASRVFVSPGRTPEEIAVMAVAALIELRAAPRAQSDGRRVPDAAWLEAEPVV
ncbi:XdhC family protein [Paraburkholderia saeva]|uniref:XdhC- CoxI domain-containing protein n=1 Tax=Paraburkholderia saeva TaxID=2777537 RepID=A0A9N8RS99_9BURK|nr:XdhC family protein [Paraburkholderia saeva]CAG4886933.1 hypothetical protein R70241_00292 [Paraburkholderia saeva]CAG4887056.1 hypothetical protein LMG31841_00326 [Paraburkholderia saeva]